jgi:hypothetical protein
MVTLHHWQLGFMQFGFHRIARVLRDVCLKTPSGTSRFSSMLLSPYWLSPPGKPLTQGSLLRIPPFRCFYFRSSEPLPSQERCPAPREAAHPVQDRVHLDEDAFQNLVSSDQPHPLLLV